MCCAALTPHQFLVLTALCLFFSASFFVQYVLVFVFFFFSDILCHKNKTVLRRGDILKFPKLAETMETIANQGADEFYTGKIGHDLIQDIEAAGWCGVSIGSLRGCI